MLNFQDIQMMSPSNNDLETKHTIDSEYQSLLRLHLNQNSEKKDHVAITNFYKSNKNQVNKQ